MSALQIAPLTDQISVLGGIVVPKEDVGCQKECPAVVKVGLSRFQKLIGELASLAPTEDSYKYESRAAFTLYR